LSAISFRCQARRVSGVTIVATFRNGFCNSHDPKQIEFLDITPFPISITARLRFTATCNKLLVARALDITSAG
jgi:hypothetical protein